MKEKGFESVKVGDTLYKVIDSKTTYRNRDSYSDSYRFYDIVECGVADVRHETEEERDVGDRYDPEYKKFPCNKYAIRFVRSDTHDAEYLTVNLTNSDIYRHTFANVYVDRECAEGYVRKMLEMQLNNAEKNIEWNTKVKKEMEAAISEMDKQQNDAKCNTNGEITW